MIGFITFTVCLNNEVTVRVAITDTDAVVPAVTSISSLGTGNVRSVNGISTVSYTHLTLPTKRIV